MDRNSKMKKKIDKYFHPMSINANTLMDVMRYDEKK